MTKKTIVLNKSPQTQIHVQVTEHRGYTRLDIREYKQFNGDKVFKPTKNGISVPQAISDAFINACVEKAKTLPIRLIGTEEVFKPTKNGISVPQAISDAFITDCVEKGKTLPTRLIDTEEGLRYILCKTVEDAMFHKTRLYLTEKEALDKEPPDGYTLFKVFIEKGTVLKQKALSLRKDGVWNKIKVSAKK